MARPRTLLLLLLAAAAVLIVIAVVYFTRTAGQLPSFMPGHEAGSTHHHVKHGLAALGAAVVALIGAWMVSGQTSQERS